MEPRKVSATTVKPQSKEFLCSNCSKIANERCSRCTAVKYCSKKCQKEHWSSHKSYCNQIKKHMRSVTVEAEALKQYEDWDGETVDLFEESVGNFWGLVDPRDYCRARHGLDLALHKCGMKNNSKLALELSIEHMLDLVWLNRGDNLGVRVLIPSIYCMVDRIQEAYDFLKWWTICSKDGNYDWGDINLPYCNLKDENMYEELSALKLHEFTQVHWLVSLFLIKYKLMVKLLAERELYDSFLMGTHTRVGNDSPVQKLRGVSVVLQTIEDYAMSQRGKYVSVLKGQLIELCKIIDKANKFVIPALLNPTPLLDQIPPRYMARETQDEAYAVVDWELDHWLSDPKILDYLMVLYVDLHGEEDAYINIEELPEEPVCHFDF